MASMKPFVRFTALALALLFLSGAALAAFDVLTHENMLRNPELKFAGGWLTSGLMLLALGMRGWRRRRQPTERTAERQPPA
jgi:hypothetical protein